MAKNKVQVYEKRLFFLLVFCILCWRTVCSQPVLESYPVLPEVTILRTKLVAVATSQIGIREATGRNDGVQVLKYQKEVGLKSGAGWCGAFCTWCHNKCNIPNPKSGVAANWFKTNLVYKRRVPRIASFAVRPGQVAAETNGTRVSHVSIIVDQVNKTYVYTIGGNETNAVRMQLKRISTIWAIADYVGEKEMKKALE